mgnify:CR=1 FL=1
MIQEKKINSKFETIQLSDFGRRPTTLQDIQGLLTLIDKTEGDIVEIGAWYGKTTFELAVRFPEKQFYTVDWLENVISDREQKARAIEEDLCKYAKMLPNVQYFYKDSTKLDYSKFDNITMVFIDGDHSYNGCKADTELALKNLPSGSIIAWHDFGVSCFGVTEYIKKEISPKYQVYKFENTKVAYIEL